ncbi:hypothetical protein SEA_JACKO_68 [Microbacterium phage Jacko]|nr:hypothetical protein SEA_JACKO_68 [Microbacterium phage Jacko]
MIVNLITWVLGVVVIVAATLGASWAAAFIYGFLHPLDRPIREERVRTFYLCSLVLAITFGLMALIEITEAFGPHTW